MLVVSVVAGAVIVDTRPIVGCTAAHIAGSIFTALRPVVARWLGWTIGLDRSVVFVVGAGAVDR